MRVSNSQAPFAHPTAAAALKRGGALWRVSLSDHLAVTPPRDVHILDLEAALDRLGAIDPRLIDIVVLRFFSGLTIKEAAEGCAPKGGSSPRWVATSAWRLSAVRFDVPYIELIPRPTPIPDMMGWLTSCSHCFMTDERHTDLLGIMLQ